MLLLDKVVEIAYKNVGVRESPSKTNRGPEVDAYIRCVGLVPEKHHYSWCQCFVYAMYSRAAEELSVPNPCIRTAGVLRHWLTCPIECRIPVKDGVVADGDKDMVVPGCIGIVDHGMGKGHAFIITGVDWSIGELATIEGNSDPTGGREGDGVYGRVRALNNPQLIGIIRY